MLQPIEPEYCRSWGVCFCSTPSEPGTAHECVACLHTAGFDWLWLACLVDGFSNSLDAAGHAQCAHPQANHDVHYRSALAFCRDREHDAVKLRAPSSWVAGTVDVRIQVSASSPDSAIVLHSGRFDSQRPAPGMVPGLSRRIGNVPSRVLLQPSSQERRGPLQPSWCDSNVARYKCSLDRSRTGSILRRSEQTWHLKPLRERKSHLVT